KSNKEIKMSNRLENIGHPAPWTYDFIDHEIDKYRQATIYSSDSSKVSSVYGTNSKELAEIIVSAINRDAAEEKILAKIAKDVLDPFVACNNRNPSPPREAAE